MDISLERILSLIPRKQDGKFVHGAIKEFASKIGLKSGNVVTDWINGRSKSYSNYLYEISAKYNVSVEWLKGETDEKIPAPKTEDGKLPTGYNDLTPKNKAFVDAMIAQLLAAQSDD